MNVDLFYVYPSAWQRTSADGNICSIDNASMISGALSAYERQATLFSQAANIYAPYYRQADAAYVLSLPHDFPIPFPKESVEPDMLLTI